VVLPTTLFRMASVSKTITALAIQQLIENGSIHLTDTLQSILQLAPPPRRSIDAAFAALTLQEIIEFHSGLEIRPGTWVSQATVRVA
jgi:CubicO group peptidase (beta-lactamase class C family)